MFREQRKEKYRFRDHAIRRPCLFRPEQACFDFEKMSIMGFLYIFGNDISILFKV